MKRLLIAWFGLFLVFGAIPHVRADDSDQEIVVGTNVGKLKLGMSADDVMQLLGQPSYADLDAGGGYATWVFKVFDGKVERTSIKFSPDKRGRANASQIAVSSPAFHLRTGLSVKADPDALWREYPALRCVGWDGGGTFRLFEYYDDLSAGVAFVVERPDLPAAGKSWGICRYVLVHWPGKRADAIHPSRPTEVE